MLLFLPTKYKKTVRWGYYWFSTSRNTNLPVSGNKDSDEVTNPKSSNQPTTRELFNTLEQETRYSEDLIFSSERQVDESNNLRHRILDLFKSNRHSIPGNAAWLTQQNVADRTVARRGTYANEGDNSTETAIKQLSREERNLVMDSHKLEVLRPFILPQHVPALDALSEEVGQTRSHFSHLGDALVVSIQTRRNLRNQITARGATLTPDSVESNEMLLNGGMADSDVE